MGSYSNTLHLISHGKRSLARIGLQEPQENHGTGMEGVVQGEVLPGFFIPLKLGLLHEENLVAIPARCFDGVDTGDGTLDCPEQAQPPQIGRAHV